MKGKYTKSAFYLSLFILTGILVFSIVDKFGTMDAKPAVVKGDDGEIVTRARIEWEMMRFRNPATGQIPHGIRRLEQEYVNKLPGGRYNIRNKYERMLADRWDRRGPYEVGGRTRALALDVTNENIILAGGVSGGMWRSTDGGASWTKTSTPDQLHSVSCIAQDKRPGKTNIWYYGTGEFWGNSADLNGDGIYKSTDGGKSWFPITATQSNTPNSWDNKFEFIWNIVVNPTAPDNVDEVLVATTLGAVYRTTDGGDNWQSVIGSFGNGNSYFTDIAVTSTGVYYATLSEMTTNGSSAASRGIFRSENGTDWTKITPDDFPAKYKRIVIAIAPSDENQVFFFAETPGSGKLTFNTQGDSLWHGLWKYKYISGNGTGHGGTWSNRSMNLPKPPELRGQINSQGSYNMVMAIAPNDTNTVFIGATAVHRSSTGFSTPESDWIGGTCPFNDCEYDWRYPNHHSDVHAFVFLPSNPEVLFSGTDGGVHKTLASKAPLVEWISLNNGYFTTQFYTVAIDHSPANNPGILGGLQDNGTLYHKEANVAAPWSVPGKGDGFNCAVADGSEFMYYSINSSYQPKVKVFRVKHVDGKNTVSTRLDPIGGKDFIWNTPFILDPNNNNIMYLAGGSELWRNSDLSAIPSVESKDSTSINWTKFTHSYIADEKITAVEASKIPANVVYYGTSKGKVFRIDNANSGDPTPIAVRGANMPGSGYVASIAVDPDDANKVIVAFSNYEIQSLFYSENGGESWTPIGGNLEEYPSGIGSGPATTWIEIMKVNGQKFYLCGTSAGLFSTAYLYGANTAWTQEGAETIGNVVIDMIDSRNSDGFVAVATHGVGMFNAKINSLPSVPQAVIPVYPAYNAHGIIDTVRLSWQLGSNLIYSVELSENEEFTQNVQTFDGIKTNSVEVFNLIQGYQKYYWRVRAFNSGGPSAYSNVMMFNTAPLAPELKSPSHSTKDLVMPLVLEWNSAAGADKYRIQVTSGLVFDKNEIDTIVDGLSLTLFNLEPNKRYYWRAKSINSDGEGIFGTKWLFRTGTFTGISEKLDQTINRLKIFPNPVTTGSVSFKYQVMSMAQVVSNLYDQNGKLLANIENKTLFAGEYINTLPTVGLSSGKYFIVVSINGFSISNSFTVIK